MATNSDRTQRWIDRALGKTERDLPARGTVFYVGDSIYSYGYHFEMARIMRDRKGEPAWVLINGDRFSTTTSGHQSGVRAVVATSGLPSMIVPFSALNGAGILDYESIRVIDVRPDRVEVIPHSSAERPGEVAEVWNPELKKLIRDPRKAYVGRGRWPIAVIAELGEDGRWHWEDRRHWLGDSLFYAKVRGRRRRFLSSFDHQESRPLYFLCELPRNAAPDTVGDAIEALAPDSVKLARENGLTVTRQGDVFGIPTPMDTREVKRLTPHGKGRIVKRPPHVLGTNHTATEVIFATGGRVYARGTLYHVPGGFRAPDHARRRLGDGKTWHLLTRNTVPRNPARGRDLVER